MSGTTIPLFTKRTFNFAGATGSVVVIRSLDTTGWTEGVLNVRVHSNGLSAGEQIDVKATPIDNSSEDPSQDFLDTSGATTVSVASGDTAPVLKRASIASDPGAAVQITVVGAGTAPTDAVLSAELVLKA